MHPHYLTRVPVAPPPTKPLHKLLNCRLFFSTAANGAPLLCKAQLRGGAGHTTQACPNFRDAPTAAGVRPGPRGGCLIRPSRHAIVPSKPAQIWLESPPTLLKLAEEVTACRLTPFNLARDTAQKALQGHCRSNASGAQIKLGRRRTETGRVRSKFGRFRPNVARFRAKFGRFRPKFRPEFVEIVPNSADSRVGRTWLGSGLIWSNSATC